MARDFAYHSIVVESFHYRGEVHVRPIAGQFYPQTLLVECSRRLTTDFPVGTKFRIKVKVTDRLGEGEYLYSSYRWPFEVVKD